MQSLEKQLRKLHYGYKNDPDRIHVLNDSLWWQVR